MQSNEERMKEEKPARDNWTRRRNKEKKFSAGIRNVFKKYHEYWGIIQLAETGF